MQTALPDELLSSLSRFVETRTGLHFPPERWGDLERGIACAAPDFNFPDAESCARWLLSAPLTRHMNEVLACYLSIGETYFFREKQSLDILGGVLLPQLLQARREERRLRIWCAGCSTGEEAYTVAILLDRLIPDIRDWHLTLLATDFNPRSLRKAAPGIYGEWSFRDTPAWLREQYFTKQADGRYEIIPRIRKMVMFSYLNLADNLYPSLSNNTSAMDIILCRNVLMYFTPPRAKEVVGNLHRALVNGGWLVVSVTEAAHGLLAPFTPVEFPQAVLYRKLAQEEPAAQLNPVRSETKRASPATPARAASVLAASKPEARETWPQLARRCAGQGRLDEALACCNKAIASDKMNAALHYLHATILQEQGQYEAAAQSLSRALYLDPCFVLAHFALGNLHQSQGRYRAAQRSFGNVLQLLRSRAQDETLSEADGLSAGRLSEIVASLLESLPEIAVETA